jgi:glutathione S-transferase
MEAKQSLSTREIAGGLEPDEPDTQEEAIHEERDRETPEVELLPRDENTQFQDRWETIQTGFVDEPRQTVEQADELVAQVMQRVAEGFAAERERLEQQWGRGEDVSTEDLRVALQRYRGFFQRLLAA